MAFSSRIQGPSHLKSSKRLSKRTRLLRFLTRILARWKWKSLSQSAETFWIRYRNSPQRLSRSKTRTNTSLWPIKNSRCKMIQRLRWSISSRPTSLSNSRCPRMWEGLESLPLIRTYRATWSLHFQASKLRDRSMVYPLLLASLKGLRPPQPTWWASVTNQEGQSKAWPYMSTLILQGGDREAPIQLVQLLHAGVNRDRTESMKKSKSLSQLLRIIRVMRRKRI